MAKFNARSKPMWRDYPIDPDTHRPIRFWNAKADQDHPEGWVPYRYYIESEVDGVPTLSAILGMTVEIMRRQPGSVLVMIDVRGMKELVECIGGVDTFKFTTAADLRKVAAKPKEQA